MSEEEEEDGSETREEEGRPSISVSNVGETGLARRRALSALALDAIGPLLVAEISERAEPVPALAETPDEIAEV